MLRVLIVVDKVLRAIDVRRFVAKVASGRLQLRVKHEVKIVNGEVRSLWAIGGWRRLGMCEQCDEEALGLVMNEVCVNLVIGWWRCCWRVQHEGFQPRVCEDIHF